MNESGPAGSMVVPGTPDAPDAVDLPDELAGLGEKDAPTEAPIEKLPWYVQDAAQRETVDEILAKVGRRGGPSEYGWHSRASQFACARMAAYDAKVGPEAGESMSLHVGSIVHEWLAEYYACFMEGEPTERARQKAEATYALLVTGGYRKAADEARRLFYGYVVKYGAGGIEVDEYAMRGKVVAVEKKLYRDLPWGEHYSARADVVVEQANGFLIVDHKTVARRDADWNDGWQLDPGMLGLEWVAAKYYKPIVGFSINGIVKTAKPDYPRLFFRAERHLVRDWMEMMRYRHLERQVAATAGNPPNFASCIRRGKCHWFNTCALGLKPVRGAW